LAKNGSFGFAEGSAMSVGLLVVRLLYRFYVCVHLSKWFTFSLFLVVCLLLSGRPLHLLPMFWRLAKAGIFSTSLALRTKFIESTKA
jgi:hypothetical protein